MWAQHGHTRHSIASKMGLRVNAIIVICVFSISKRTIEPCTIFVCGISERCSSASNRIHLVPTPIDALTTRETMTRTLKWDEKKIDNFFFFVSPFLISDFVAICALLRDDACQFWGNQCDSETHHFHARISQPSFISICICLYSVWRSKRPNWLWQRDSIRCSQLLHLSTLASNNFRRR